MESCTIFSIRAHERDDDLISLPTIHFNSGRTGIVRLSEIKNLDAAGKMSSLPDSLQNAVNINTDLISGSLKSLAPASLKLVSRTNLEHLWDHLVSQYHYLGYRNLLGHRLKYLAYIKDRPIAALSWSAPALKLRVRDRFIGWSEEQRKRSLNRIGNNSRFLILPWVNVPHLASHILARNIRRLNKDWKEHFKQELWVLETFVDPRHFKGTSYKAANWRFLGHSSGSGKKGQGYLYHGNIKEVYVYVLNPYFRKHIGCKQKPCDLFHRPPTIKKVEELQMILRHADWNPDVEPCMELTEQDIKIMADELVRFHEEFHNCFGRTEHQRLGMAYISGLLSNSKAKSIEPIALEFIGQKSVRSLQRFMKTYRWSQQSMEEKHQSMLSAQISSPDGMINTDSSEFLKKGKESVGVARQYCGEAGKTDNCQSGVFIGYSSEKGYGLLTSRLYMPKSWFSDEQEIRRKENFVPPDLTFQTKPQIALDLISKIVATGLFPAKWIGCDATFGSDSGFLNALPKDLYYFAAIRSNSKVFLTKPEVGLPPYKGRGPRPKKIQVLPTQPKGEKVSKIAKSKIIKWKPVILAEGAKGPILADVTRLRVYPSQDDLPEEFPLWLFMRRNADGQIKYAFSNAPEDMPFSEMCKASTMRWPIEQCFQDGKSYLGMNQYEHRSWPAWHRHMTYVFLALHFLLRLRIKNKKNSGIDSATSSTISCGSIASELDQRRTGFGNIKISHLAKS